MQMSQPRVLVIQDISAGCRISMNVAQPVLSVLNNEVNVLPTALLSTHTTSGFENYTYLDLTEESDKILVHWKELGRTFDGILIGYLGSVQQIERIHTIIDLFLNDDGLFILDPVMADGGLLYDAFDDTYVYNMQKLSRRADILLPNLTEAAFLTGTPYKELQNLPMREVIERVASLNKQHVIITGVTRGDEMGAASYNAVTQRYDEQYAPYYAGHFEGTGDLFSSVVAGLLLQGKSIHFAMETAVQYTNKVIKRTSESDKEIRYGVQFETDIPFLIERLYSEERE